MLSAGKRVTDSQCQLTKVTVEYLYSRIKKPDPEVETQIRNLRLVHSLDKNRYNQLKRELPFVVCATFSPAFRKTENFASVDSFIIDIDHISAHDINSDELKSKICADRRVTMCFISPSGDGMKVLFTLKEKCYDAGEFSIFYKAFAKRFAMDHGLEDAVDCRTCDVCRACFVSHDREAYYNPDSERVDFREVIARDRETLRRSEKSPLSEAEEPVSDTAGAATGRNQPDNDPDDEIMRRIKGQLNLLTSREKVKKDFYVPREIEAVMENVRSLINDTGVSIVEERDIQYGKQLSLSSKMRQAEINIFFGRRGFSVVAQPRHGTSETLNTMLAQLLRNYLETLNN